jgi:hypothetical protein
MTSLRAVHTPPPATGLSLTERRILAATADGATTVGEVHARIGAREARPYRWVGGVHLAGPDSPWRWDEGTESIVTFPDR